MYSLRRLTQRARFAFSRPKVVDLVTRDLVDAFRTYLNQNRKGKENNSGQMGFRSRSDFER